MFKKTENKETKSKPSVRSKSPVTKVLLLVAIAVVVSIAAYAWVTGFTGQTTTDAGQIEIQSVSRTHEALEHLVVYVKNIGQGPVNLKQDGSVYVNDVLHYITHSPQGITVTATLIPVPVGQTVEAVIDKWYTPGEHLKIRIVTFEGAITEFTNNGSSTENVPLPEGTYSLNINVVGTGCSVQKSPNQPNYTSKQEVQLIPSAPFGWQFDHWSGDLTGNSYPGSLIMNSNKSVTATFTQKEYPLSIEILGAGTVAKNPNKPTYHIGDIVQLNANTNQGWSFAGYTGDITTSNAQTNVTIDQNPTVTASFTQLEYSLTVTSNPTAGGPVETSNPGPTYHFNDQVTLTSLPVDGYRFKGWSGHLTGTTNPATINITGNMIVTANYEPNPVTLTLNVNPANSGIINSAPTGPYRFEDKVVLTAVPIADYEFSSWSGSLTGSSNPSELTLLGDTTITANFVLRTYPLTIAISPPQGGNVTKTPSQATYHLNDLVSLTAVPAAGYTFAGWSQDATGTNTTATVYIDENPQVTATFVQTPYSLTTSANPTQAGSITRSSQGPYLLNDQVTLKAVPATGYTFTGWSGDLAGSTNPAQLTVTRNMVVTANFEPIAVTLTLKVDPLGKGVVTANPSGPYHYGDVVKLTAVPIAEYSFDSWSGDASGAVNPVFITLNGDKTVTAKFKQNPTQLLYALSFDGPMWDIGINDWGNPPWAKASNQGYNSPNAAWSNGAAVNGQRIYVGPLSTDPTDTSAAAAIHVSFDYRASTSSQNDFQIRWSGNPVSAGDQTWHSIASLGGNRGWTHYTVTITDPAAFALYFRFQFLTQDLTSDTEAVWIDNIVVTMNIR